jgi:hypothetical protein
MLRAGWPSGVLDFVVSNILAPNVAKNNDSIIAQIASSGVLRGNVSATNTYRIRHRKLS